MSRDYDAEIDALRNEIENLTNLVKSALQNAVGTGTFNQPFPADKSPKKPESAENLPTHAVEVMYNMHPDNRLSDLMVEMCDDVNANSGTGRVTYFGVFASGDGDNCRQSNWIRKSVKTDELLKCIDSGDAVKVLNCINSQERLNLLLAILRQQSTVAQLTEKLGASSSGQIYHHLRPLLAADLIKEDDKQRGLYYVVPHRVQGIIMLLVGICDMLDTAYTQGSWEETE
ncbi:MAG: winged helix-turn-helix domain-containing protein [Lachnospiraceae bacterium]|nr:winged helix-turn-helix domain-containing protein [Lachnospiraceae bacterium]